MARKSNFQITKTNARRTYKQEEIAKNSFYFGRPQMPNLNHTEPYLAYLERIGLI